MSIIYYSSAFESVDEARELGDQYLGHISFTEQRGYVEGFTTPVENSYVIIPVNHSKKENIEKLVNEYRCKVLLSDSTFYQLDIDGSIDAQKLSETKMKANFTKFLDCQPQLHILRAALEQYVIQRTNEHMSDIVDLENLCKQQIEDRQIPVKRLNALKRHINHHNIAADMLNTLRPYNRHPHLDYTSTAKKYVDVLLPSKRQIIRNKFKQLKGKLFGRFVA